MYSVHCTPMCNVHRKWYSLTMNSQRSVFFFQFCISKFIFYFILYTCHFFHFSYCCCGIPTNTNGAQSYLHKRDLVAQSVLTHRFLLQRVKVKKGPRYKMERKKNVAMKLYMERVGFKTFVLYVAWKHVCDGNVLAGICLRCISYSKLFISTNEQCI